MRGEPCGNCSKFKGAPDPVRRQRTAAEKELKSHPQTCQGHHQRSFMRGQIKDPSKKIKDCLSPSSLVAEVPWKGHDSESERWRWDENGKTWGGRATKQRGSPGPRCVMPGEAPGQEHAPPQDSHRVGRRLPVWVKGTRKLTLMKMGKGPDKTVGLDAFMWDATRPSLKW